MVTVLVAGDVKGSVPELLNKVAFYHKSGAGPFNMAFCVGPLTSRDRETELAPVLSGEKPPAVPLYFCEPGESPSLAAKLQEHPSEVTKVAENLFYLGRGGVKMVGKLTVAFLGARHTKDDVELCRKAAAIAGYGGADLFLTSQWARGMEVDLPERCFKELSAADVAPAAVGSEGVAEVAVAVKPRYHFAASEGVFFQRPPYLNSSAAGAGDGARHTTRFIALGGLREGVAAPKNKAKKWLHALKLEPIVYMKKEELYRRTADTTGCPGWSSGSVNKRSMSSFSILVYSTGDGGLILGVSDRGPGGRAPLGQRHVLLGRQGGEGGSSAGRGAGRGVPNGPVDPTNCTVFVGNLVYGDVTSEQLETLFGAVGPIVQVRITPGSVFGFVEFERHQDAARAISSMDGFTVAGNQMRLTWGNQKNRRTPAGMDGGTPQVVDPSNMNLFVGNLPKDGSVSKQDIREALVTAGAKVADIVDVRLTYKGYAFVDFSSHEAAARAMDSMQDKQIKGSHVSCRWGKVSPARARQEAEMQNRGGMQEIETKAGVGGTTARARQETDPRQECWFCLASPHLEDHLVCSVADEVYMAQPKGALVPGHVLIIPVSHQQRYSELSDQGVSEVERYKVSFSKYCYSHSCEPFMFERCIPMKGAHHMHIQAVAIPTGEASRGARILMRSEGNRLGMGFTEVPGDADLKTELKEGSYFFAEGGNVDPMGRRRSVPLQFGRDVAARLLSMPERAYWRDCVLPKEKEISQADVLKEAFKAFDFTQADDEEGEGEEAEAEADAGAGKPGTGDGDTSSVGHKRPAGDGDEGGRGSPRELDDSKKGAERDSEKRPRVEVS